MTFLQIFVSLLKILIFTKFGIHLVFTYSIFATHFIECPQGDLFEVVPGPKINFQPYISPFLSFRFTLYRTN